MLSLDTPPSQHLHIVTYLEALQTPSFWVFTEASLHWHE